jgi:ABC-type sugar transport system ATPase subunit
MADSAVALLSHISKRFGATRALDDVTFTVEAGAVHGLVGENGAGKSTLIKILSGVHAPDSGHIRIADKICRFDSPRDAIAAGIVLIPQEMRIVPAATVAENVMLGQEPTRALGMVDTRRMNATAGALLARLSVAIDPRVRVDRLGVAERQLVVIARALAHEAKILVLDEPTAALEAREVARLFEVIAGLKRDGVGIVFISHRLNEVLAISDRITVMRDGRVVDTLETSAADKERLIQLMTGRDLEELRRPHALDFGAPLLGDGRLVLHEREIVGLAGLLGSGTTALLKLLYGDPATAIGRRIGFVPGERAQGLVMGMSVRDNIALPSLGRIGRRALDELVAKLMDALDIRPRDPARPVRELSGGNQQKVMFARWLAGNTRVLLLDEPTHGIDIGAKAQIHRLIRKFADDNGGVVFASSEMIEVLSIADAVLVLKAGHVAARLDRTGDYTERALRAALGG